MYSCEQERNLISTCSRKRSDLPRLINRSFPWAVSQQCEATMTCNIPVVMTFQKSRIELNDHYGREIVDQSSSVWSTLNKYSSRERKFAA